MRLLAFVLLTAACSPSGRSVQHALLDLGYSEIKVLGWAPGCAPRSGAYFEARIPVSANVVTGVVCCARGEYACDVTTR